jgi:NAD(P)-dependent dehydrogenase (short-subunit alcohol dehydrogenase family)
MYHSAMPNLVVVTGAGSGIGRATAERFARRGSQVIVADINERSAEDTVARIEQAGGRAYAYRLDVTDADAWEGFAAGVRADHGVPDVLVNNAGILISGSFLDHSAADWERIVGVNLLGVVHGCRVFGAQMVESEKRGQIVNVASAAAFVPLRSAPAYAVTKAGVLMLSECLRIEFASKGIGVTAICPTVIKTNIARHSRVAGVNEETEARFVELGAALQDRLAWTSPDKVARAVARSVARNWAIVPVNPDAWLVYALRRISPGLLRAGASVASFDKALSGAERLFPWFVGSGQAPASEPAAVQEV